MCCSLSTTFKSTLKANPGPCLLQVPAAQPDPSAKISSLKMLLLFELPLFVLQLRNLITLILLYLP